MFLLSPSERIPHWRAFRDRIKNMDELEQLNEVVKLIAMAPTVHFKLDVDDPSSWVTPWELLNEAEFDDAAKAYFAEQTLILSGWDMSRFKIIGLRNDKESFQTVVLLVDEKYVINYYHAQLINDTVLSNTVELFCYVNNAQGKKIVGR
jgi:hypothetical protein